MPNPQVSEAYVLHRPARQRAPVVLSSPHSGRLYPPDLLARSRLDRQAIRSSEDAFVDQLFGAGPSLGLPLIRARVARAYLDLNRAAEELDPALIEGVARTAHNPRIASGLGVIPRVVAGGRAIYDGRLSRAEAGLRISRFWHPYHATLRELVESTRETFGEAVLIDCHSMPHEAIANHTRPGTSCPEVVLGDRFGASAGREVVDRVEAAFAAAGFRVARNAPFSGAHITRAYGCPSQRIHAVQVEIDRALYMDEARILPLPGFDSIRARISAVLDEIAGQAGDARPLAAE